MNANLATAIAYAAIVFGAMYFLFIAPQQKQRKAQAALLDSLLPGDEVVTAGGLYGLIRGVDADSVRIEIAEGVVVTLAKAAVVGKRAEAPRPEVPSADV